MDSARKEKLSKSLENISSERANLQTILDEETSHFNENPDDGKSQDYINATEQAINDLDDAASRFEDLMD